jgi:hypothetical protein
MRSGCSLLLPPPTPLWLLLFVATNEQEQQINFISFVAGNNRHH